MRPAWNAGVPTVAPFAAARIETLLTIVPPFWFPVLVVKVKTTGVLVPPPLSTTVLDREGDTLYETGPEGPEFELSVTSTLAVAPFGTDVPVSTNTVRFEEALCAPICVGENDAPPMRTDVPVWKAKTFKGSGVTKIGRAHV